MATYVIGDVQGCYDELRELLSTIQFKSERDTLWFVGDLVNRGPKSLASLRYIHDLGDNAVVVLGNHDLHLLSCRFLDRMVPTKKDTTQEILDAPDCDKLLDWLRKQKLAHYDHSLGVTMVHAGLPPSWNYDLAWRCGNEVQSLLSGDDFITLLDNMYGNEPRKWSNDLGGWERVRFIVNALTRLRFSTPSGEIDMKYKGPLGSQPNSLLPWYQLYEKVPSEKIVFGHWSSLRLSAAEMKEFNVYPTDTGAVWGGQLTALRLEDLRAFRVQSKVTLPI